jgi:hypothetical protein
MLSWLHPLELALDPQENFSIFLSWTTVQRSMFQCFCCEACLPAMFWQTLFCLCTPALLPQTPTSKEQTHNWQLTVKLESAAAIHYANKTNLVSVTQRKSWTTSVLTKDATSTMHSVSDAYSRICTPRICTTTLNPKICTTWINHKVPAKMQQWK